VTEGYEVLRRERSRHGELALIKRSADHLELRVNGVFVMDTVETSTERALATETLSRLDHPGTILLGGLGFGMTLQALLDDNRVERVVVAEIEPAVVRWLQHDVPGGAQLLSDDRVEVFVGDVMDLVARMPPGSLDAIVLDIDNGPDQLVYDFNAVIYRAGALQWCLDRLGPSGVLAVWSSTRSAGLESCLDDLAAEIAVRELPVRRGDRSDAYVLYLATPRHHEPANRLPSKA
jgi:spermidine synthase